MRCFLKSFNPSAMLQTLYLIENHDNMSLHKNKDTENQMMKRWWWWRPFLILQHGCPREDMGEEAVAGCTDRSTRGILTQGKPITMEDMKGTPGVNRIHGQIIIITITIIAYIIVPTTWTDKKFVTHCPWSVPSWQHSPAATSRSLALNSFSGITT